MILQLNAENFSRFGTILTDSKPSGQGVVCLHTALDSHTTLTYRTLCETRLHCESGLAILSVCLAGSPSRNFYLDKPVRLRSGIQFSLTGFQQEASVRFTAATLPQQTDSRPADMELSTRPTLQITELYTFFYQEKEPGFLFSGESHSMLELTYVDRGTLHSVADGVDLLLQQGQMALYAPHQWHMQYADMDIAPRYVTISFHCTDASLQQLYNRALTPDQKTVRLLHRLLQELDSTDRYRDDMLLHTLELMLLCLLRHSAASPAKRQTQYYVNTENDIILRAQKYVSRHVQQKLSVPALAQAVDVSPSYLTTLFHKHLQLSPGEYIRRIKLQESKQLIREGGMNFSEIARALHYSTVHHLSRQFKEKFGITPTEYARSVR